MSQPSTDRPAEIRIATTRLNSIATISLTEADREFIHTAVVCSSRRDTTLKDSARLRTLLGIEPEPDPEPAAPAAGNAIWDGGPR
jgi:hypothetical protein